MPAKKKLLIIANSARELELFKGEFITACIAMGYRVVIACGGQLMHCNTLTARGAEVINTDALRNSWSFFADFLYLRQIYRIIKDVNPDVVFNYTIKPVLYASLLAKLCGVGAIYSLLPGLGYVFSGNSIKLKVSQWICLFLYRLAFACNKNVIFLNQDDRTFFVQKKLIPEHKAVCIDGEGVDLQHYVQLPYPGYDTITFLFVARLLREKGIEDFIQAAEQLSAKYPNVAFRIAGDYDEKTDQALKDKIAAYHGHPNITYIGYIPDIRSEISRAHVFVLPSFYREGVPRSSMECMAMARPIITTDWVGCKETVIAGQNGYLVPIKDPVALVQAMERFIRDPDTVATMGAKSRQIAEQRFDVIKINQQLLHVMMGT